VSHAPRPPVFLDRDGTLIVEMNYLSDPDKVRIEEGVVEGLALLETHGRRPYLDRGHGADVGAAGRSLCQGSAGDHVDLHARFIEGSKYAGMVGAGRPRAGQDERGAKVW